MIFASHVSVANGAGVWWSYNCVRRSVHLAFHYGAVDLTVCSEHTPRLGAFLIDRVDPRTWRIIPLRYIEAVPDGHLLSESAVIHERIGIDVVTLLDTPEDVGRELAELGR